MPRRKPLVPKETLDAMKQEKPEPAAPSVDVAVYSAHQMSLVMPTAAGIVTVDVDQRGVRIVCNCLGTVEGIPLTMPQFDAIAAIRAIQGRVVS